MKVYRDFDYGFTMIEMLVVIVIISILLLFATPNFISQVSYANETHISSDALILESEIENFIRHNGKDGLESYNNSLNLENEYTKADIERYAEEEKIFYSDGLLTMNKILNKMNREVESTGSFNDESFYEISDDFIELIGNKSILKGKFLGRKVKLEEPDRIRTSVPYLDADYNNIRVEVIYLNEYK